MKTKTIRQKPFLKATPERVYQTLMNAKEHAAFSSAPAKISSKVGGKFLTYYGYIEGKNLELKKGKKIVQAWKAAESQWPEDHFSTVTFDLRKKGKGTEVHFTHQEIPEAYYQSLKEGWKEYYWKPMNEYFSKKTQK